MITQTLPNPTYFSFKPSYLCAFVSNEFNQSQALGTTIKRVKPRNNETGRYLSSKARKRLMSKVDWLEQLAETKRIFNNKKQTHFNFKLNFVTLTLPTLQQHLDSTIKSKALKPLLDELRKYHGLKNYVWRAECQANGNIHFHLVTDTYIHHYILRAIWNRKLKALGYIGRYRDKFLGISFSDYEKIRNEKGTKDLSIISSAWNYGVKTRWSNPNTTDIHALYKVKNVSAYIGKYMSKNEESLGSDGRYNLKFRRLKGRIWGCSESLSRCKSIVLDRSDIVDKVIDYSLNSLGVKRVVEKYFSLVLVSFRQLRKEFGSFIDYLVESVKRETEYVCGSIANKSLRLLSG